MRLKQTYKLWFAALSVALLVFFALDICSGSIWLLSEGLWSWSNGLTDLGQNILVQLRLPRAITAI